MSLQRPAYLQPGDRLCVVLPSGAESVELLQSGIDIWRDWGYEVVLVLPHAPSKLDYLAGTDCARLTGLQAAINDPKCRAILCGRGGYGATRLLPDLEWSQFLADPKWIVGFSDSTALLWAAAARGVVSLHGPIVKHMPLESPASRDRLHACLTGRILQPLLGKSWSPGGATGLLMPANLTVATALLGTPDWPLGDRPVILAIEEINELDYRIDRMLTQWRNSGAFDSVAGIALGRFCWTDAWTGKEPYGVETTLRDCLLDLGIPVVAELEFGHGEGDNLALPVGVQAVLDGDSGTLIAIDD